MTVRAASHSRGAWGLRARGAPVRIRAVHRFAFVCVCDRAAFCKLPLLRV
jgi:hypothetical protein